MKRLLAVLLLCLAFPAMAALSVEEHRELCDAAVGTENG